MVELTFHGGVGEIGGNKILLTDDETKIFLDFGKNFGREKEYYDDPYLSPRHESQLLELGMLPDVPGLYKDDEEEPDLDGVLITHPHLDHWGYTAFLKDSIPLYTGEVTSKMILNYEYCSSVGPKKKYYLGNYTKRGGKVCKKDFRTFRTGDTFDIDSLDIEPVHVDHSVPAAYGYIIQASSETLAYTGDFRLHGPKSGLSEDFIERAEEHSPDVLITEATNITGGHLSSEEEVNEKLEHLIGKTGGLAMVSTSIRDVDRIRSVYRAAEKNGRKLAINMKQAFLLKTLREEGFDIFDLKDVLVFRKEKSRRLAWEEEVITEVETVSASKVNEIQDELVLIFSYYDMNEIVDVEPEPGSIFILCQSEPFDEEGEIQHEKLLKWCDHFGIPQYQVHASGHILPHQLKEVIQRIGPELVIPVHTENPALFQRYISDVDCEIELPEEGGTIDLDSLTS